MLSTRHQWFPFGPLSVSHLIWFFPDLFLPRSRPWLLTTAAGGGLEPAPASRLRGAFPHQSSSYTHWALLGPLRSWRTIIGVVDHLGSENPTPPGDPPVLQKTVHIQVGEQGANHTTLRSSTGAALPTADPRFTVLVPLLDRHLQPHL